MPTKKTGLEQKSLVISAGSSTHKRPARPAAGLRLATTRFGHRSIWRGTPPVPCNSLPRHTAVILIEQQLIEQQLIEQQCTQKVTMSFFSNPRSKKETHLSLDEGTQGSLHGSLHGCTQGRLDGCTVM
jgi:hypothetical protein